MYIQINQAVALQNMSTPIASAVGKIRQQATYPMANGNTEQHVVLVYFENYSFGDANGWAEKKALDIEQGGDAGPYVKKVYRFERTSEELDSGISTQSLYDDVKAAMVADGFTDANLVVTP